MTTNAHPILSSAAASTHGAATPALELLEAQEVVAELQPRAAPPRREVVTSMAPSLLTLESPQGTRIARPATWPGQPTWSPSSAPDTDSASLLTSEEELTHPRRDAARRDDVEPLTADLRRLHVTVDRQFLEMLEAARDGLSHSIPGASTEQVLKEALGLLLEKQARARGQVKKPRKVAANVTPTAASASSEPFHRRTGPREAIPAEVRRAVWERDEGRCTWPLDSGGRCGSTHRLELDHIVPWARWSTPTEDGLRLLCGPHNRLAARQAFGARCVERYAFPKTRPLPSPATPVLPGIDQTDRVGMRMETPGVVSSSSGNFNAP